MLASSSMIFLAQLLMARQVSCLKQAEVKANGILLAHGGVLAEQPAAAGNTSEQPAAPAKPALRWTFHGLFNSSRGQVQEVSADFERLAISMHEVGAEHLADAGSRIGVRPNATRPRDGMILDLPNGHRFDHQRFFDETVCYKMDLGSGGPNGVVSASSVTTHRAPEGESSQNTSAPNDTEPVLGAKVDFRRMALEAEFRYALSEVLGAPLELYEQATPSILVGGALREVVGQNCSTWAANRSFGQPLPEFMAAPMLEKAGWRAMPEAVLKQARDEAEKELDMDGLGAEGLQAIFDEEASFCVNADGVVLATTCSRRMSFKLKGGLRTLWAMTQHTTAIEAPHDNPSPEAFDADIGTAGGRCVDLTAGSVGPSELGVALNAQHRLARINAEADGHWQAAPYALWDGITVAEAKPSLGTELGPLRLPLRSALMGEGLSAGAGAAGEPELPLPPTSFDAQLHWPHCLSMGIIRNQGACGSCWAVSATGVLADRFCVEATSREAAASRAGAGSLLQAGEMARLGLLLLAPEHLVDCDKQSAGCGGGRLDDTWRFLREHGAPDESCSPYRFCPVPSAPKCSYTPGNALDPSRLVGREHGAKGQCNSTCAGGEPMRLFKAGVAYAVAPPGDVLGLQRELLTNGPVQVAFYVFSDFHNYRHGVYFRTPGAYGPLGGHAVRLLGWGVAKEKDRKEVDYWLCANSWSPNWGLAGFFRIRRGTNECGIETTPAAGLAELTLASPGQQTEL